eukprot:3558669-Pyramimonas_sp.AAC.1
MAPTAAAARPPVASASTFKGTERCVLGCVSNSHPAGQQLRDRGLEVRHKEDGEPFRVRVELPDER